MKDNVIAIDIGGTNIRVALLSEKLEIVKKETAMTMDFHCINDFLHNIMRMIQLVDCEKTADCIGIVIPAPWTEHKKIITDVTNIPFLENLKVKTIQDYFKDYKVYIENDVNVIALLESDKGAAKEYDNSIYITVSTGIGSGIMINNQIYHGAHGYAGEIGGIIVSKCKEGYFNSTLEIKCSGKALEKESLKLYGDGNSGKELFSKYENGDEKAKETITRWLNDLTSGLASVIQIIDPEIIVLGGPVILNHHWVIDTLRKEMKKKLVGELAEQIQLVKAEFGLEAGLIGAGYYALKHRRNRDEER